jgi:hypothetical protein
MAGIKIYRFRKYDIATDEAPLSRRWGTRQAIQNIACGDILENTEILVDETATHSDIRGLTEKDYAPVPYRFGSQTQVS